MDDSLSGEKFILTKIPHTKRVTGFPLDSLLKDIKSGDYYYDIGDLRSDVVAAVRNDESTKMVNIGYCIGKAWWHQWHYFEYAVFKRTWQAVNEKTQVTKPALPIEGKAGFVHHPI